MGEARIATPPRVVAERSVEAERSGAAGRRSGGVSPKAAAFAVWYLRVVAFINFLTATELFEFVVMVIANFFGAIAE